MGDATERAIRALRDRMANDGTQYAPTRYACCVEDVLEEMGVYGECEWQPLSNDDVDVATTTSGHDTPPAPGQKEIPK